MGSDPQEKGYRIALSSPDLAGIADLILKHHEKWDGTGYPLGLKGEEIPIECRILSIVDALETLTCASKDFRASRPQFSRSNQGRNSWLFDE